MQWDTFRLENDGFSPPVSSCQHLLRYLSVVERKKTGITCFNGSPFIPHFLAVKTDIFFACPIHPTTFFPYFLPGVKLLVQESFLLLLLCVCVCLKLVFEASCGLSESLFVYFVTITFDYMTKCNFSFVVITLDTLSSLQVLKGLLSLLVWSVVTIPFCLPIEVSLSLLTLDL